MLKKQTKIFFFLLLIFLPVLSFNSYGQKPDSLKKDISGNLNVRTSDKIREYLNDDSFLYDTEIGESPESFWQRILYWFKQLIYEFFCLLGKGGNLVSYIFYAVIFAALVFIILKLMGISPYSLFLRKKKIKLQNLPVFEEDINAVNFEKIISEAVDAGDYRKAVRFLYIKFLKILSENEEIEWKKEKTNKDYKQEMENSKYKKEFSELTKIYEYVWYGEFKINLRLFNKVFSDFTRIFKDFE